MSYRDYIQNFDYNIEDYFVDLPGFIDVTYNGSSYPVFENRALKLVVAFTHESKDLREDGDEFKFHLYNGYEDEITDKGLIVVSDDWNDIKEHINYSLYQKVFPDFDYNLDKMIPEGFIDCSSKNDTCPSFYNKDTGLIIYYNYMDPDKREMKGTKKFALFTILLEDDLIVESNNYSDILSHIYINNEEEIEKIEKIKNESGLNKRS